MPKKPKARLPQDSQVEKQSSKPKGIISKNSLGEILIEVYAKPGAKQNAITEVNDEGVNIQINAPPVEGSANTELVKYMAAVLGLKSSSITLERGHKSRRKVLKITGSITEIAVIKKINEELPSGVKLLDVE